MAPQRFFAQRQDLDAARIELGARVFVIHALYATNDRLLLSPTRPSGRGPVPIDAWRLARIFFVLRMLPNRAKSRAVNWLASRPDLGWTSLRKLVGGHPDLVMHVVPRRNGTAGVR